MTFVILLAAGANIEARTERGTTPLVFALVGDHGGCCKLLLEAGAKR